MSSHTQPQNVQVASLTIFSSWPLAFSCGFPFPELPIEHPIEAVRTQLASAALRRKQGSSHSRGSDGKACLPGQFNRTLTSGRARRADGGRCLYRGRLADALRQAAVHLSLDNHRIDDDAAIVG